MTSDQAAAQGLDLSQFQSVITAAIQLRKHGSSRCLGVWRSETSKLLKGKDLNPASHARLQALTSALDDAEALLLRLVAEARVVRASKPPLSKPGPGFVQPGPRPSDDPPTRSS